LHLTGYYDPNDPFNDAASPNSWTKPLNQTWDWATDRLYGVNLGGLFVLEPFISPALFQKYPTAVDEWTLSLAMAADASPGGGLQPQLEAHYDTFIVRLMSLSSSLTRPSTQRTLAALVCTRSFVDGARHCSDGRCGVELDSFTHSILGH